VSRFKDENGTVPIRRDLRPLYRTPEYFAARDRVLARSRGRCEHCLRPKGELVEMISGKTADGNLFLLWRTPGRKHWTNQNGWPATKKDLQVLADVETWRRYRSRTQLQMAHTDNNPRNHASLAYLCAWCHLALDQSVHKASRVNRKDRDRGILQMVEGAA
jgi:hypothetical protein